MLVPAGGASDVATRGALAGADGCRAGWVVATRSSLLVVARLADVHARVLGVDMPIGLPVDGPRVCDQQARRFLGRRGSTVFPTPPRACLGARDHADAVRRARAATGAGISVQAFHLLPKIGELDALVDPARPDDHVEVHPECAFALMSGGQPLPPKRTPSGAARRIELLAAHLGAVDTRVPRGARLDDVLDAYAVLWSTERFVAGTARIFGDGSLDARGLPMRIVA